ncbi:MAG: sulfotransferase [Gemmataceae bacterium]|nr:sulfotransferase [Gemmataceae bacterium]
MLAAEALASGDALWADYRFDEALRVFESAARQEPDNPAPLLLAAKRLFALGRFEESARLEGQALERRPEDSNTRRMLAELLDRQGQRERAERLAREALRQSPQDARAARALAHIVRGAGRTAEAAELLRRQVADHPSRENWRVNHELALCLDRLGDYAGAMAALLAAKAELYCFARPLLNQWHQRARRREEFARALDGTVLRRWREVQLRPVGLIAILAGHPRSGTTLLEQMLAAHPGVVTTDETAILRSQFIEPMVLAAGSTAEAFQEINGFDTDQLEAGREFYFRATQAHLGEAPDERLLIEKDPLATCDLGFMLRLLPEARVIFPLRDPRDVCVSFFFTLVPLNPDSAPALDLAHTCAAAALSLRVWQHWRKVIPQPWVEVRYERLVRDAREELGRLTQLLQLPWEERMLAAHEQRRARGVRTPTYSDVAQPLYTRAIGRWRHYARWLEPHLGPLAPLLKEFGYD